ncbi:MAG: hypothetical protein HMLIMOIP_002075 [Candidatus Nitrosomirales archaeon]|jgi:hypothetical protein
MPQYNVCGIYDEACRNGTCSHKKVVEIGTVVAAFSGFSVINNGGGDLFIRDNKNGVLIRISHDVKGTVITASERTLTPWSVNGLSAIIVH